jgi:hypothetical protein
LPEEERAAPAGPMPLDAWGRARGARRLLGVSAAGLLAGFALSRLARGSLSKPR